MTVLITPTNKLDVDYEEQYAVIINNKVFFRVIGEHNSFTLSTATTGEHDLGYAAHNDCEELISVIYSWFGQTGNKAEQDARDKYPLEYDVNNKPYISFQGLGSLSDIFKMVNALVKFPLFMVLMLSSEQREQLMTIFREQ